MKKTLLLVGALCVLGTTAFGATSFGSEFRAIDYQNGGTDKIEYTLANGSTDIAENLKFYFDVDLDTEYNGSNRDKYWDTDWRLAYTMPQEVLNHTLTVSYEADYDYNYADGVADDDSLGHELRFKFAKDNYFVAPMYTYDDDSEEGNFELDFGFSAAGPLGTSVWVESYNYFDKDGHEDFDTDLEIYVDRTIPFYGVNLKPELGFEGYNMLDEVNDDISVYAQLRIDKTFEVAEGFAATPYVAYTNYNGNVEDEYYEFGIETSVKF